MSKINFFPGIKNKRTKREKIYIYIKLQDERCIKVFLLLFD